MASTAPAPLKIRLELTLDSLNKIKGRHWSKRHAGKQAALWAFKAAGITWQDHTPTTKRKVTLTRVLGPNEREYDYENLVGGNAKAIIDAGTDLGLWRDDSPKWLEREYRQDATRREEGPAVELIVEDAE